MTWASSQGTYRNRTEAMKKARVRASKLGHKLGHFMRKRVAIDSWHRCEVTQLTAQCDHCSSGVTVRWLPNGRALRLGGFAVKLSCEGAMPKRPGLKLEQELRSYTLGLLFLGGKFFEPTVAFLNWMQQHYRGRRVYDVGAGHGHVTKALNERGVPTTAIDMLRRDHPETEIDIADATCYPYEPNTVVMLCRPCHGGFALDVIQQAINCRVSTIMYVGKTGNLMDDLDTYTHGFQPVLTKAGQDNEGLYVYKVKHAKSR